MKLLQILLKKKKENIKRANHPLFVCFLLRVDLLTFNNVL